ncbi:Solute carrier family 25 member 20 [Balamuthia mandrillaris]
MAEAQTTVTTTKNNAATSSAAANRGKELISGSFGGLALVLVGHPLDTVKVRLQTAAAVPGSTAPQFLGPMDCVRQTVKNEGWKGFYKGVGSPLVGISMINAVLFFSWAESQNLVRSYEGEVLSYGKLTAAGALTGFVISFFEGPVELVKSKMQVQYSSGASRQYSSSLDCFRQIVRHHGVRGIFQGLWPTLLRDIPANVGYFVGYEFIRRKLSGDEKKTHLSPLATMTAGGLAGILYWASCFPFDVIKSRMQIEPSDPSQRRFKSTWQCAVDIQRTQGFRGFWKGFSVAAVRSFPANAACFTVYEVVRAYLG